MHLLTELFHDILQCTVYVHVLICQLPYDYTLFIVAHLRKCNISELLNTCMLLSVEYAVSEYK